MFLEIPAEPPQTGPRTASVDWPSPTLPWLASRSKAPAYSDTKKDKAALDLLFPLAFGPNSDLYQRLVLKEQKVDRLEPDFANHPDPELFTVYVPVKDPKDLEYVRDTILAAFKQFTERTVDQPNWTQRDRGSATVRAADEQSRPSQMPWRSTSA